VKKKFYQVKKRGKEQKYLVRRCGRENLHVKNLINISRVSPQLKVSPELAFLVWLPAGGRGGGKEVLKKC
jgi:hypothetical protein